MDKTLVNALADQTAKAIQSAVGPIVSRLDALEKRIADLPKPKEVDERAIVAQVAEKMADEMAGLRAAVEAVSAVEMPELPDIPKMVEEAIDARIAVEDMERSIEDVVRSVVSEIPTPKDGKDGEKGADGKDGRDGRDGLDVKDLFRADGGRLVAVMSDGTTKDLGIFVGKDGEAGKDGRDGFSLKDFDAELMKDGRTVLLKFADATDTSFMVELGIPAMIYRGVWKDGEYRKGDTVTWGGSLWHCDVDETAEKPDSPEKHWTLAAKRGRDGKDGVLKPETEKKSVRIG